MNLILASSSPYRKQLLQQLQLEFNCISPDIDETAQTNESAEDLVKRLAKMKAMAVAQQQADAIIIASDQVAVLNQKILGKPDNFVNAKQQLQQASGQTVVFYTSLAVLNSQTQQLQLDLDTFTIGFRQLSETQIENYLQQDQPYNCAGSFRSERLGIALFESMQGNDPNTLIGLPLIKLIDMLANEGLNVI